MYVEDIISTAEMMKFSALSLMTPPETFGLHTFWYFAGSLNGLGNELMVVDKQEERIRYNDLLYPVGGH